MVERPTCNRTVEGSTPFASISYTQRGCRIAAIAGDCKSPDFGLRWFESSRPHSFGRFLKSSIVKNGSLSEKDIKKKPDSHYCGELMLVVAVTIFSKER